jgi:hypothetical protein
MVYPQKNTHSRFVSRATKPTSSRGDRGEQVKMVLGVEVVPHPQGLVVWPRNHQEEGFSVWATEPSPKARMMDTVSVQ